MCVCVGGGVVLESSAPGLPAGNSARRLPQELKGTHNRVAMVVRARACVGGAVGSRWAPIRGARDGEVGEGQGLDARDPVP